MDSCTIRGTDYSDSCQTIRQAIVIAMKQHTCGECGKPIHIGTGYEHYVGSWDGTIYNHRTCLTCVSLRDTFFPEGGFTFGYIHDYIIEKLYETHGVISSECIKALTPEAQEFVFNQIEKIWEEDE